MAKIPLETSADVRGAKKLNKELGKTDSQLEKITKRARGAAGAAERLAKQADPQKRYNDQMARLAVAVKKGGLEIDHARTLAGKYQRQLDRAGQSGKSAFGGRMLSQVATMAAGYVSVSGAIGLMRSELEAFERLQERTTQKQLTAHQARRGLLRNLAGVSAQDQDRVLAAASSIAQKQGLSSTKVDAALGAAVSANPDPGQAVRAVRTLLPIVNDLEGKAVGEFVGAVGDVGNALNTNNVLRSLGLLQATVSTGRPTDIRAVAMNAPRVLTAYASRGIDPRKAAGVFAGLTVGGADPQGEVSRTAALNLLSKSKKFFADHSSEFDSTAIDTADERLDLLLSDPQLARRFVEEVGFRAAGRAGVESLLFNPDGKAREAFRRTQALAGSAAQQEAMGRRAIEFITGGRFESVATSDRVAGSLNEQLNFLEEDPALTTDKKEEFLQNLIRTNPNFRASDGMLKSSRSRFRSFVRFGKTIEQSEQLAAYEQRLALLETLAAGGASPYLTPETRFKQENDPEFAATTNTQISLLTQAVDQLRRQTDIAESSGADSARQE